MKFKKLSLLGFKSFADALDIKFGEGITAIVGPNGCGKSNVADAVRWVLGEQSAKILRGSSMQDVIFNGTANRSKLSYAEVSLTFDNTNRSLFPSYDFSEVVISRSLDRSGESIYYVNGAQCKRYEIKAMLRDAGFAIEGYTIIGQGRVSDMISAKPEDRRAIFEEAAGISKYKKVKEDAENKNEKTRLNLERIKDAMAGDSERLGPLTRQAEKARQYNELREQLKYHEINFYINKYETASDRKDALSEKISEFNTLISKKQAELENATALFNAAMDNLHKIDQNLESYRNELLDLSVDKEKISGKISLLRQQLDSVGKQNESLMSANATHNDNYSKITVLIEQKQEELSSNSQKLAVDTEELNRLNDVYKELADKVSAEEEKLERARRSLMDAMERKAAVNMSIGELTAERASLIQHTDDVRGRLAYVAEQIENSRSELSECDGRLEKMAVEKASLCEQREENTARINALGEEIKATADALDDIKREHSASVSRRDILTEMQNSLEGYALSVRKLLGGAKNDARISSAIQGVVGQILNVKDGFETAIEIALGSAVSNVVTRNEEDANLLISYLKENRFGRVTFLPLTSFKPHSIDRAYMHLLDRPGCYGVATDAVTYDPKFEPIVSGLLGGTVIVEDLPGAIELAKDSRYGFRIVTLDGEMILPQGSITGGSKKSDMTNVFAHERELKELVAHIGDVEEKMRGLQAEYEAQTGESKRLSALVHELTEDIHEYELAEASDGVERSKLLAAIQSLCDSENEYKITLDDCEHKLEELAADIEAVEKTSDELGTEKRNEEDDLRHREFEALRARRDEAHERASEKNIAVVRLRMDCETLNNEINRLKSEAVSTAKSIETNDFAILANNRQIQEYNDKLQAIIGSDADSSDARCAELKDKLSDLSRYKGELNDAVSENEQLRQRISDEVSKLTEEKYGQELLLAQVDSEMSIMQDRISEEYGLDYTQCLELKDGAYDAEAGEVEIIKLKRRISNLGNINHNAIEESRDLLKAYHEKELQCDDLEKSLADEERVIKEMSATMLAQFNECFEKIRTNFREIFAELFNGGYADLELLESDDPLRAGVEIKAQPPSKNLQSISLLSGGEKTLTAIAILFAILRLRPMPFCLLDEIEAALDDANVGRFASYLKKFSADTQFIVITHRKPTMEQADCLYGVTMETEGVTKIVSVRLAEAAKNAVSVPVDSE